MSQTGARLVDHVIPNVPVRQWVLSLPIPLRLLLAAQPEFITPVLQVVQRVLMRDLRDHIGLMSDEGHGGDRRADVEAFENTSGRPGPGPSPVPDCAEGV